MLSKLGLFRRWGKYVQEDKFLCVIIIMNKGRLFLKESADLNYWNLIREKCIQIPVEF